MTRCWKRPASRMWSWATRPTRRPPSRGSRAHWKCSTSPRATAKWSTARRGDSRRPTGRATAFSSSTRRAGSTACRWPAASRRQSTPATLKKCNNDHGISFDGKQLAVSSSGPGGKSLIYTLPITGGAAKQITPVGPSYWHGWSPDGQTLAFCGERGGEFDVYTVPAAGGPEQRLTTAPGLDDGPEYTPDGQWIYFNSLRSGTMQIWRMHADGAGQEQVTNDEYNNWFPPSRPTASGSFSFRSTKASVPRNTGRQERSAAVNAGGRPIERRRNQNAGADLRRAGTMNVNSWSPDGKAVGLRQLPLGRTAG